MFILARGALINSCGDAALANLLVIIQRVMLVFQIVVPIIAIAALVKILLQKVINPENKKTANSIRNWVILLISFFFIPMLVNFVMNLLDDDFSLSACWNYARNNSSIEKSTNYINTEADKTKKVQIK